MKISAPVTWHGAKGRFADRIIAHFPSHQTYCDLFGGGAAVLLAKPPSPVEIYNDLDRRLNDLFTVLRDPCLCQQLIARLQNTPYSRAEFESSKLPSGDPVESARRLMVRQRQSFGGRGQHWSFSVQSTNAGISSAIRRWQRGIELLPLIHHRLQSVQLECDNWTVVLDRYDREDSLFFLDPPYHPSTRVSGGYEHEFSAEDHEALVSRVLAVRGMVVLAGYANPSYERLERNGWKRIDYDVVAHSSTARTRRIESLWLSPSSVTTRDGRAPSNSSKHKMRQGAYHVHNLRVGRTSKKIKAALERLRRSGKKPTITAIARLARVSREHLTRRYRYLLV